MKDRIYLIVRLVVRTSHKQINDAIRELETMTVVNVPSTENVEVLECGILNTHSKHNKIN